VSTKTYARIENDTVVELLKTDGDIAAMFHRDLHWIDVTGEAGVAYGWRHDGKRCSPTYGTAERP